MEKLTALFSGKMIKIIVGIVVVCVLGFFVNGWLKGRTVTSDTQTYSIPGNSPAQLPVDTMQIPTSYGTKVDPIVPSGITGTTATQALPVMPSTDSVAATSHKDKNQQKKEGDMAETNNSQKTGKIATAKFSLPKKGTVSKIFVGTYKEKVSPSSELVFQSMNISIFCDLFGYLLDDNEVHAKGNVQRTDLGYVMYIPKKMHDHVNDKDGTYFFGDGETLVRVSIRFLKFDPSEGYQTLIQLR